MKRTLDYQTAKTYFRYNPETGKIIWIKNKRRIRIFDEAGCRCNTHGYRMIGLNYRIYPTHCIAWLLHHGNWPAGEIDHINGVRDDNRITNLRDVGRVDNSRNTAIHKNNTSGVCGVCWSITKNKWRANIRENSKQIHLGYFDHWFDAVSARKAAEFKLGYHKNHGRSAT